MNLGAFVTSQVYTERAGKCIDTKESGVGMWGGGAVLSSLMGFKNHIFVDAKDHRREWRHFLKGCDPSKSMFLHMQSDRVLSPNFAQRQRRQKLRRAGILLVIRHCYNPPPVSMSNGSMNMGSCSCKYEKTEQQRRVAWWLRCLRSL